MSATYLRFDPDPSGEVIRLPESEWDVWGGGSGGGGGVADCEDCFPHGSGSPEGVRTGDFIGQQYLDEDNDARYVFNGTPGANTGWV